MDNDLRRLKTLCGGLFFVLLLLTVIIAMAICVVVSGTVIEMSDPGLVSDYLGISSDRFVVIAGFGAVVMGVSLVVLVMMLNITNAIYREYSPFTIKNVKRLEVIFLAYLLLPVIVSPMIYAVIGELTALEVIILSFSSVLMAAIFYCLSLVFRYGCWLQKESDETL